MADIADILNRGGAPRIALLRYCVMSVTMEPVFVFLAQDYRLHPSHARALGLYDVFCSPQAPARIRAPNLLEPMNLRLAAAMPAIRRQCERAPKEEPAGTDEGSLNTAPDRCLFDHIAGEVAAGLQGGARWLAGYDPRLEPERNLPGGRMNAGQRFFVDNIWRPVARPRLVSAGFWQISTID